METQYLIEALVLLDRYLDKSKMTLNYLKKSEDSLTNLKLRPKT